MPQWPGQGGQCMFCVFRNLAGHSPRAYQARNLHAFSLLQRDRSSPVQHRHGRIEVPERHRVEEGPERKGRRGRDKSIRGLPIRRTIGDGRPRDRDSINARLTSHNDKHRPDPEQLDDQIVVGLESLQRQLKTSTSGPDSQVSQFDSLDPQNSLWNDFEDSILALLKRKKDGAPRRTWSRQSRKLYEELENIYQKPNWRDRMPRALHHRFIDYVLQQQEASSSAISKISDMRYPTEWYNQARSAQREIHLHIGPTNSGKTYNALKRLEESGDGFYCGPLRLLAHEVWSRFRAKGMPCDLVTGDDVRRDESSDVRLSASTVEMVDTAHPVEVAVIDEIQMMAHSERGWAWTRAFLGANAREVHLCGEARVAPLVRELAASMGDTLHIHNYERLNPLKAMTRSLRGNLKYLRKGDCVVSFSIVGIHALKKQIEKDTGKRVAIVYGSLPPETRANQAALFNDPDNDYDYLVASDAIGMGLNLAVKRIIFETIWKFNGKIREVLSVPQIKQIAGRAGRYRTASQAAIKESGPARNASVGLVTCLDEGDLPVIQEALRTEAEPIKAAGLRPPTEILVDFSARLPKGLPFDYIMLKLNDIAKMHPRFQLSDIRANVAIARIIEPVHGLSVPDRYLLAASPASTRNPVIQALTVALAKCIAEKRSVTIVDIPEIPLEILEQPTSAQREYLRGLEDLHQALVLYLWLSYRFISVFQDQEVAMHAKSLCEEKINTTLTVYAVNYKHRKRLLEQLREANVKKPSDLVIEGHTITGVESEEENGSFSDEELDISVDPEQLPLYHEAPNSRDLTSGPAAPIQERKTHLSDEEPNNRDLHIDPAAWTEGPAAAETVATLEDRREPSAAHG